MRKVHYDYWADYIYSITNRYLKNDCKVLELAAGNCKLAQYLSEYYPNYYASDLSLPMLLQCRSTSMRKVCCDMRMIPFKIKFDLIVMVFDSINYLTSAKDLKVFFSEINNLLMYDGVFTFDASLEKNSYKHVKYDLRRGSSNGFKYVQKSDYNPKTKIHKNLFLITHHNGLVTKEVHIQKIYPFETYFKLIDKAGLKVIECYEAFTFKDGNSNCSRIQFIVGKK